MNGTSSSDRSASGPPDAHLRGKAIDVGLLEERSTDGVMVAKERDFERNELGWEVRTRNTVRRNWNLARSQHEDVIRYLSVLTCCVCVSAMKFGQKIFEKVL